MLKEKLQVVSGGVERLVLMFKGSGRGAPSQVSFGGEQFPLRNLIQYQVLVHVHIIYIDMSCTAGLRMSVIFTAKNFPSKLKYLRTSNFDY